MDTFLNYQNIIKKILLDNAKYKSAYGVVESHVVFDDKHCRYTLLEIGWENKKYIHDCIIHVEIIKDKIWIQYDGTEQGIAIDLLEAGISYNEIVLGFHHPKLRKYTDFAVA